MSASEPHGLLSVFEVGGVGGIVARFAVGLGDSVFDEDASEADGVEPVAGVGAFAVRDEDAIAASWKDQDGGAGVWPMWGIDGQGGHGDVGKADDAVAADEVIAWLGGVCFVGGGLRRLGRAVGPEGERDRLGLGVGIRGEERYGEDRQDCEAES